MKDRRDALKMLTAWALALPLAARFAPAAAAPLPGRSPGPGRRGFIVNGWVLTRADLAALQIDALRRRLLDRSLFEVRTFDVA